MGSWHERSAVAKNDEQDGSVGDISPMRQKEVRLTKETRVRTRSAAHHLKAVQMYAHLAESSRSV